MQMVGFTGSSSPPPPRTAPPLTPLVGQMVRCSDCLWSYQASMVCARERGSTEPLSPTVGTRPRPPL